MKNLTIDEIKKVLEYYDDGDDFKTISEILEDQSFDVKIDELTDDEVEDLENKFCSVLASKISEKDYELLIDDEEISNFYIKELIIATNNSDLIKKTIQTVKDKWLPQDVKDLIIGTKDNEFILEVATNSNNLYKLNNYYLKELFLASQGIQIKMDYEKYNNLYIEDIIIESADAELIKKIIKSDNDFDKFKLILETRDAEFIKECIEDSSFEWTDSKLKELIIAVKDPDYIKKWIEDNNGKFYNNDEAELIAATNDESYIKSILKEKDRYNKAEILKFTGNRELIKECISNNDIYGIDNDNISELLIATNDEEFIKDVLKNNNTLNRTKILKRLNNKNLVKELLEDRDFNWTKHESKVLIILTEDQNYIKQIIQREKQDNSEEKYGFEASDISDLIIATGDKDLMKEFAIQQCQGYSLRESNIAELLDAINDNEFTKNVIKKISYLSRSDILKQLNNVALTKELIEEKEFEWSEEELERLIISTRDSEYIKDAIENNTSLSIQKKSNLAFSTGDRDYFLNYIIDNKFPNSPYVMTIMYEISDEKKYNLFCEFREAKLKNYIFEYRQSQGTNYIKNNIEKIMKLEGVDEKEIPYAKECLMKMFEVNNEVLEKIDFSLLQPQYINSLGLDKINQISCYPDIQESVLNLDNTQFQVFSRCIDDSKVSRWTPLAQSILENIDEYDELITNITLSESVDIEKINLIIQDKNIFNIQTIDDVNNYEQIRKDKCDEWIKSDDIQQKRLAVLENIYGQSIEYSEVLIRKYGQDIESIQNSDLKDYIKSVNAILSVEDPSVLEDIYGQCKEVENIDKVAIEELLKSEYCKLYNEDLFTIEQGEQLEEGIYEAGTDFKILLTSLSPFHDRCRKIDNYNVDWNRPAIATQHFCASYIRNDMIGTAPVYDICYRIL